MKAKEKALEVFTNYMPDLVNELGMNDDSFELNKKFALITVNEIIKLIDSKCFNKQFYMKVKQEIEKL